MQQNVDTKEFIILYENYDLIITQLELFFDCQYSCLPKTLTRNIFSYLNMKMNSIRRPKNTATLSIVLSITTSCLLKLGKNRTNFKILSNLNVLSTDKPEPSAAIPCTRPVYISNELSSTITPSKTLKPSLIYRNKPYAPTEIKKR